MWRIGDLKVDGRVVLGPMSGYTFRSYREFMAPFGASVTFTEMTSDSAILNNPSCRDEYLSFGRLPYTGLQVFGSDPDTLARASARALELNPDIDFIDVNMSCPAPKVVRAGAGSELMADPAGCGRMVRRLKAAVDVPVTVKVRLGRSMEELTFRDVIGETVSAGADAVSIHARTVREMYSGEPHLDMVRDVRRDFGVATIVSGNIYTPDDAVAALEVTGADAVMVARGGVGNPYMLTQTDALLRTGERLPNPTVSQQVDWCLRLAGMVFDEKGERTGAMKMRSIAPRFVAGCRRCREYRLRLATGIDDWGSMAAILEEVRSARGGERIRTIGYRPRPAPGREMRSVRCGMMDRPASNEPL